MGYYNLHRNDAGDVLSYEYYQGELDTSDMGHIHKLAWRDFGYIWIMTNNNLWLKDKKTMFNQPYHKALFKYKVKDKLDKYIKLI